MNSLAEIQKECATCNLWNQRCSDTGKVCDLWLPFMKEPVKKIRRDTMNSRHPHIVGVHISNSTYKTLQAKMEARGTTKMEPLVREILDKFADSEREKELREMLDKQNEYLETKLKECDV